MATPLSPRRFSREARAGPRAPRPSAARWSPPPRSRAAPSPWPRALPRRSRRGAAPRGSTPWSRGRASRPSTPLWPKRRSGSGFAAPGGCSRAPQRLGSDAWTLPERPSRRPRSSRLPPRARSSLRPTAGLLSWGNPLQDLLRHGDLVVVYDVVHAGEDAQGDVRPHPLEDPRALTDPLLRDELVDIARAQKDRSSFKRAPMLPTRPRRPDQAPGEEQDAAVAVGVSDGVLRCQACALREPRQHDAPPGDSHLHQSVDQLVVDVERAGQVRLVLLDRLQERVRVPAVVLG